METSTDCTSRERAEPLRKASGRKAHHRVNACSVSVAAHGRPGASALLWAPGSARFQRRSALPFPRRLRAWTWGRPCWRGNRKSEPGTPAKVLTALAESAHAGEIEAINNQRLALRSGAALWAWPWSCVQAPESVRGRGGGRGVSGSHRCVGASPGACSEAPGSRQPLGPASRRSRRPESLHLLLAASRLRAARSPKEKWEMRGEFNSDQGSGRPPESIKRGTGGRGNRPRLSRGWGWGWGWLREGWRNWAGGPEGLKHETPELSPGMARPAKGGLRPAALSLQERPRGTEERAPGRSPPADRVVPVTAPENAPPSGRF